MKSVILVITILFSIPSYGQRTFEQLITDSKKSKKFVLLQITIPERIPELSPFDPIDLSVFPCTDGGCFERITEVFEFSKILINDDKTKEIVSKYSLKHFPINLIFDLNGELIIKNNSMYGDKFNLEKLLPILTNPISSSQLKEMERKLKSCTIEELKNFMAIKRDSLVMTDLEMIDLFVDKASEKDYDNDSHELILKFVNSVNSPSEHLILENLNKFGKNYIDKDLLEFHKPELQKRYSLSLLNSLIYAYRINDENLFNEKITKAKNSSLSGEDIDGVIQNVQFLYFKVLKKPEELFKVVQPSIEKQLNDYNLLSKKTTNNYEADPKETLAENLNNAANAYYEAGGKNISNLNTVLAWSKKSTILIYGNPNYLDTYAHLLYITENKIEAIAKQKQALTLAKNLYRAQMTDPQVKELIGNLENELKKMETGTL